MTTPDPSAAEQQNIALPLEPGVASPELGQQKSRNRRLAAIVVSASLALTLVLGGAAYAGYQFLLGGAQPAERMPATVVAYANLDFKPGLDQQRKLQSLVRKFPKAGTNADSAEQVVEDLLKKLDIDDVDAQKDLADWVGVRASAGLWLHKGEGYVLTAVATTDDKAASAALGRITAKVNKGSVGYVVEDGVAMIAFGKTGGLDAAKAAVAEAKEHPFTESDRFTPARNWLGDDHVGAVWIDLSRIADVAKVIDAPEAVRASMVQGLQANGVQGTFAFGVRATDFGVEAHYRTFGYKHKAEGLTDALTKLGAQPETSDVAALVSLPDLKNNPAVTKALDGLGAEGGDAKPLTKAEQATLTRLMSKTSPLTAAEEALADRLMERAAGQTANPMAMVRPIIEALSGATLIASGSNLRGTPAFALSAQVATAADAQVLGKLQDLLAVLGSDAPKLTVDGTTVTVASDGYGKAGGTLAGNADFTTATAGGPAQVQTALYVNVTAFMTVQERENVGPIKAVGVVSGYDGGGIAGSIRVLVG